MSDKIQILIINVNCKQIWWKINDITYNVIPLK